jgi:hypothetical protein
VHDCAFVVFANVPVPQSTHPRLEFAEGGLDSYWPVEQVFQSVQIEALAVVVNVPWPHAVHDVPLTNSPGVQFKDITEASALGESAMAVVSGVGASTFASSAPVDWASTIEKPFSPSTVPQPATHTKLGYNKTLFIAPPIAG